ncbi:MAG: hypothetical protein IPI45_04430 [Saprospiraceae bacterium]|nr:hypothetical protein [Saprospiraceae bacterium]MBK7737009.1 hypothetical protein [Saprospiraceae bacterium]MBK7914397.1 hypothetical protein [Saprospiraceae bacterium]
MTYNKTNPAGDEPAYLDLDLLLVDLDELFFLAMTSPDLECFDFADRQSFVRSYRQIRHLLTKQVQLNA